jgi:hypothetical protein
LKEGEQSDKQKRDDPRRTSAGSGAKPTPVDLWAAAHVEFLIGWHRR